MQREVVDSALGGGRYLSLKSWHRHVTTDTTVACDQQNPTLRCLAHIVVAYRVDTGFGGIVALRIRPLAISRGLQGKPA